MKMEQSVSKRRHINVRRRGITQKKECNIQNTAKVLKLKKKITHDNNSVVSAVRLSWQQLNCKSEMLLQ